jgi:hypothetical protein
MRKFWVGVLIGLLIGAILNMANLGLAAQPIKLVVNGREVLSDPPPQMIGNRVFVPIRFVAEALGAKVEWDEQGQAVKINSQSLSQQDLTSHSVINQNGIWYADTRWLVETMASKYPGAFQGLTAPGDLQMQDQTIHLSGEWIGNRKYWDVTPLLQKQLLTPSDLK